MVEAEQYVTKLLRNMLEIHPICETYIRAVLIEYEGENGDSVINFRENQSIPHFGIKDKSEWGIATS